MKPVIVFFFLIVPLIILNGWELAHDIYLAGEYKKLVNTDASSFFVEYYPSLHQEIFNSGNITFDGNLELMTKGSLFSCADNIESELDLDVYRCWLRSTAEQSELRIGLQKINFGTATYLRSLQWFDRINALDPRQQTEGLWSLLVRYYTLENSNYWFWAIYNESHLKGQELVETRKNTIEMGGRLQLPIFAGDIGFSFHTRALQRQPVLLKANELLADSEEKRFGLDWRWDIGIGFWLEGSVSLYEEVSYLPRFVESYSAGADYTFGWGNGLHLLAEHQYLRTEDDIWQKKPELDNHLSLLAADYPVGLYDTLLGTAAYDHENHNAYYYLSYQRAYNYVSVYLNLSISPDENVEDSYGLATAGKTAQLLIQLNY